MLLSLLLTVRMLQQRTLLGGSEAAIAGTGRPLHAAQPAPALPPPSPPLQVRPGRQGGALAERPAVPGRGGAHAAAARPPAAPGCVGSGRPLGGDCGVVGCLAGPAALACAGKALRPGCCHVGARCAPRPRLLPTADCPLLSVPLPLCPPPETDECELYYVERDTLFSFHKVPFFMNMHRGCRLQQPRCRRTAARPPALCACAPASAPLGAPLTEVGAPSARACHTQPASFNRWLCLLPWHPPTHWLRDISPPFPLFLCTFPRLPLAPAVSAPLTP